MTLEFEADWNSYSVRLSGTVVGSGTRRDDFAPSPRDLVELEGTYCSPVVAALYRIEASGDELSAHHVRHGKIALIPLVPDEFASDRWFLSNLRFERAAGGEVTGLRVSGDGGGVRNLRFVKLPTPLPK